MFNKHGWVPKYIEHSEYYNSSYSLVCPDPDQFCEYLYKYPGIGGQWTGVQKDSCKRMWKKKDCKTFYFCEKSGPAASDKNYFK